MIGVLWWLAGCGRSSLGSHRPTRIWCAVGLAWLLCLCAAPVVSADAPLAPGSLHAIGYWGSNTSGAVVESLPGEIGSVTRMAVGEDLQSQLLFQFGAVATSSGQLFMFGNAPSPSVAPVAVSLPGQTGTISQLAAGGGLGFLLVATSSGQLYGLGNNGSGQLGLPTDTSIQTPTPISLPGQVGVVTQVAAGLSFSLVLTSSDQLYYLGDKTCTGGGNPDGPPQQCSAAPPEIVTLPGEIGTIAQIAAGGDFSLVLTTSGQLFGFGDNTYGQLGDGLPFAASSPPINPVTQVQMPVEAGAITQISAGREHSLVLTASGQLYAFGNDDEGQVGYASNSPPPPPNTPPNPTPTVVTLPGQTGSIVQIAAGAFDSFAVTSSGQLYGFGTTGDGELNQPPGAPSPTPMLLPLPSGTTVDAVATSSSADGEIVLAANLAISSTSITDASVGAPYSAAITATGGTPPLTWRVSGLPAGLAIDPTTGTIAGTPTSAGAATVTATVIDSYGIQASGTFTLTVNPPTPVTPPAPRILRVSQSHAVWSEANSAAALAHGTTVPIGTRFSITLNQRATIRLAFTQTAAGRRVNGKCVPTTRHHRTTRTCTQTETRGVLTLRGHRAVNSILFYGRLSRTKRLKPGRYTVAITATTRAGYSHAHYLTFRIVS